MIEQILDLGKNSLIYGIGSVITRFINLLLLPLFTAYLSPEDYGVLAMLALLTMLSYPVFSLGISAAMGPSYFEGNNRQTKSTVIWTAFTINFFSATILFVLAWSLPELFCSLVRLPEKFASLVKLSIAGCAFSIIATSLTQRVQFEKQARIYVTISMISAGLAIIISALTVVYYGLGAKGIVVAGLISNMFTFIIFLLISFKTGVPKVSLKIVKELLRLGLPLVPSFAFLFILMHANKYILEWYYGLEAVGIYSIGFNFGTTLGIITSAIATAWYPFYMSYMDRQSESGIIFGRIFSYYFIGVGFFSLLFFIAAKPVVYLLTNNAFHEAYMVVGLVATTNYFVMMYQLLLPGMYFKKEISVQSLIQFLAVIVSFPLNFLLVKYIGIFGASMGLMLGHLILVLLTFLWNYYRKSFYIKIEYEWKRIGAFSIIYVLMAFLSLVNGIENLIANFILSLIGIIVTFLLMVQLLTISELSRIPLLTKLKFHNYKHFRNTRHCIFW